MTERSKSAALIQAKLHPPRLPDRMVPRPRVAGQLKELIEAWPVVWVCATAGAGKTTAVQEAGLECSYPMAWLTLDHADRPPGRLVTYLEGALARVVPSVADAGTRALAAGAPHVEATGLLADALEDTEVLLVIDQLERVADALPARAVISALARYAPVGMRLVLISRTELRLDFGSTDRFSQIAAVGEDDLAFTTEEAAAALERISQQDVDPVAAVKATGGWVTGVLFEAWRSESHRYGAGGEADPLHGYLSSQILGHLTDEQRDFLVGTSLLEDVSVEAATALGETDAAERLAELRHQHLPVLWSSDGTRMRSHLRFREYLMETFARRPAEEVRRLRLAHGRFLLTEGRSEEATEAFLYARDLEAAAAAAENAVFAVLQRGDFDVAEAWFRVLGDEIVSRSITLTGAELMVANAREDYGRGQRVADRLVAMHRAANRVLPGELYGLVGWCYFLVGRLDDDLAARSLTAPSPEVDLLEHAVGLEAGYHGISYSETPAAFGCPLDVILRRVHLGHGRLDRALEAAAEPWQALVHKPWQIEALIAAGRLHEALKLYEEVKAGGWTGAYLDTYVAVELTAALGRHDEAWNMLVHSRDLVARSGSSWYQMLHLLTEAKLALRVKRDPYLARGALGRIRQLPGSQQMLHMRERLLLWDGLRLLLEDDDELARETLAATVDLMRSHERLLELPTAAVYLAEAAWRCGDEDLADASADLALSAARRMGTNHGILQALLDFPAVAARRVDAERTADTPWHALGRALADRQIMVRGAAAATVRVHDFGLLKVTIGEEEITARLRKSFELLAYLAGRTGEAVPRDQLLDALFDGRTDDAARAYLRQAITRLLRVLPDEACVRAADGAVWLSPDVVLSDAMQFEWQVRAAQSLQDAERRRALVDALRHPHARPYLDDVEGEWVSERRARLQSLTAEAHLEVAHVAFAAGEYRESEQHARAAITADPYRESAWRLIMRVRSALGDDDGVIATFRSCSQVLMDAGIAPADATREMLSSLRR